MTKYLVAAISIAAFVSVAPSCVRAEDAARFAKPMAYFSGSAYRTLTKAEAKKLFAVRVRLGADVAGVHFVRAGEPDRIISTCAGYAKAKNDGFHGANGYDSAMSSFLVRACGLLDAVLASRPIRSRFVDRPRVGLGDIASLSPAVIPQLSLEDPPETDAVRDVRGRRSVAAIVREKSCSVKKAMDLELVLLYGHTVVDLQELTRLAFDGDGREDIVVLRSTSLTNGTFAAYDPPFALSRTAPNGLLRLIAIPPAR